MLCNPMDSMEPARLLCSWNFPFSRGSSLLRDRTPISCSGRQILYHWATVEVLSYSTLLFSHLVVSDSSWPCELQHTRPPCPSSSPGACSNSCPLSQWCHPTISSSVTPFSSCPQSFSASGSFPMNWPYTSWGQSIWASASASVLPMNIQSWFPLGFTALIFLLSRGLSRVFSSITVQKHQFYSQPSLYFQLSHPYMTAGKTIALTIWTFVGKVMSRLFTMLPRLVTASLPRSKRLFISS